MKKILIYGLFFLMASAGASVLTGCSEYEPTGYTEVAGLAKVSDLKAEVSDRVVKLTWNLPNAADITGVQVFKNNNRENPVTLDATATSYDYIHQPMGEENLYTVRVLYTDNHVSQGESVYATVPVETLPGVTDLTSSVDGRTVTLKWKLPEAEKSQITGIRVIADGEVDNATIIEGAVDGCELKGQPIDRTIEYTVEAMYDEVYASEAANIKATIPYIAPKLCYLMTEQSIAGLPSDDEMAAATWFVSQPDTELIYPDQINDLDADIYSVIWIEIDRNGLELGWQNLPASLVSEETIAALKAYSARGGSLFLANMATQLTVPLGIVPENMAPTVYGNGDGGSGDDIWTINPYLGWMFKDNNEQGFYDRTAHAIFKDCVFEVLNGYPYASLPLIGPGQREDHNCLWDCNLYGRGDYADVIRNFEMTTNSLVLATWGQVQDHCIAGLVDFNANSEHGRCVAMGLAAYEWNQNSGPNIYQHNIEQLTTNILNYLK